MLQLHLQHVILAISMLNFLYMLFLAKKISNVQMLLENAVSRAQEKEEAKEQDIHVDLHNRLLQIQRNRYSRDYPRK
jgi:hypothetical protein